MDTRESPDGADVIDFAELWRSLWGYKYLIAGVFALSVAAAVALALTATPIYRAQAVLVEVEDSSVGGGMASVVNQLGGLASLAGLNLSSGRGSNGQSRAVLESRQMIEDFVGEGDRLQQVVSGRPEMTPWLAVKYFQEHVLSISQNARNGRITVSVEWKDPAVAASWANDFVKLSNERVRAQAIDEATRNIAYLKAQIAQTTVVDLQRVMYNIVQSETQTLMLANARADYAFRIVDPAVTPEQRVRPQRTMMVAVGGLVGLFLGLALALTHRLFARSRREQSKT